MGKQKEDHAPAANVQVGPFLSFDTSSVPSNGGLLPHLQGLLPGCALTNEEEISSTSFMSKWYGGNCRATPYRTSSSFVNRPSTYQRSSSTQKVCYHSDMSSSDLLSTYLRDVQKMLPPSRLCLQHMQQHILKT